jgi:hypothetical protein
MTTTADCADFQAHSCNRCGDRRAALFVMTAVVFAAVILTFVGWC